MNLLETNRTLGAHIEFTTNCNLKCVYCAVQNQDYIGRDLEPGSIELYVEQLKKRNVLEVTVSGHGETTVIENWHVQCNSLLEQGCKLDIITNLSKTLSVEEIDTFSLFNFSLVSCDSVNLKTFKALRKGSDFRTVLFNISCILGRARSKERRPPIIGWTSVVCDKNVLELVDLVNFGLSLGIGFFSFSNVVAYAESTSSDSYMHITEMPKEEQALIPDVFEEIEKILIRAKIDYEITAGIRESIEKIKIGQVFLSKEEKKRCQITLYIARKILQQKILRETVLILGTEFCLDPEAPSTLVLSQKKALAR
ncbi:radical SAM protein [Candidatus Marimicrobium litorale]|uniref:radical SAM protein n=1 Tax=Candidatus Marimicrobium litorale TaxID=2518991 RepID=UPI00242A7920|nr:radical SAM protein [Candidatus Marimicrobium litorale]